MKEKNTLYVVFIFIQSILYGIGNPVTKLAFESLSVFWCLTFRFGLAFLVFFVFFHKKIIRELKQAKLKDYLPAGFCMSAAYISVNLALQWTTATNVGFLMSLPVVIVPVLAVIILKKRYSWRHIPVQILVVAGLYLMCCGENGFSFGLGELAALVTALSIAGALVYGERALENMGAITISAVQTGLTAVISFVAAVSLEELHLSAVTPTAWLVVLYLAIGCTFVAYLLQNTAVAHISSHTVSMLQTFQPVATAVGSYLILGEMLTLRGYIGAGIIVLCIIAEGIISS